MESRLTRMTKSAVLTAILARLEQELEALHKGAKASFAAATDPDSKAENKYDTRTLEASYVARGQAQRVTELQEALRAFSSLQSVVTSASAGVRLGSLVGLEMGGSVDYYYIGPAEGGVEIQVDATEVMVITAGSPLGARLTGKSAGEKIQLPSGQPATVKSVV